MRTWDVYLRESGERVGAVDARDDAEALGAAIVLAASMPSLAPQPLRVVARRPAFQDSDEEVVGFLGGATAGMIVGAKIGAYGMIVGGLVGGAVGKYVAKKWRL